MIDTTAVLVGAPDISFATGFVCTAATTATMPTDASTALGTGWTDCGDISEDGIAVTTSYGTESVKDWNLSTIRTLLTSFEGGIDATFVTTNEETLKTVFGEENVTVTNDKIACKVGAYLPENKAFAFNMKDGDRKIRVVLPNAQVIPNGNIEFRKGAILTWPVHFDAAADASGNPIYIYAD